MLRSRATLFLSESRSSRCRKFISIRITGAYGRSHRDERVKIAAAHPEAPAQCSACAARGAPDQAAGPAAWLAAPLLAALLLPLAVVPLRGGGQQPAPPAVPQATAAPAPPGTAAAEAPQPEVSVYLSQSGQIETLPLEEYVSGVLAAEMPADFELEALKAQAVAARTFIARRLLAGDHSGVPVPEAAVSDTVSHQAYISQAVLERDFASGSKRAGLAKLRRAVLETRGIIMTYKGQPITASFLPPAEGIRRTPRITGMLRFPICAV